MSASERTRLLRLATRGSRLALAQSRWVARRLEALHPGLRCALVLFRTQGDRRRDRPLPEIGGKGLFTAELEAALRAGEVELAVHSLKDLPTELPSDLGLAAVPAREDPADLLITLDGRSLEELPRGARVGTGSPRRRAQLLALRPDLEVVPVRGNVDTRLRKLREGSFDALVLAAAGLRRLGLEVRAVPLPILPAPGQGALGVEARTDRTDVWVLLAALDDPAARAETTAERAFLEGLGGGCAVPVAARGRVVDGRLRLVGRILDPDGRRWVEVEGEAAPGEARALGLELARRALDRGARALLDGG